MTNITKSLPIITVYYCFPEKIIFLANKARSAVGGREVSQHHHYHHQYWWLIILINLMFIMIIVMIIVIIMIFHSECKSSRGRWGAADAELPQAALGSNQGFYSSMNIVYCSNIVYWSNKDFTRVWLLFTDQTKEFSWVWRSFTK